MSESMTFWEDKPIDFKAKDGEQVTIVVDGERYSGEFVYRGTNLETNESTFDVKLTPMTKTPRCPRCGMPARHTSVAAPMYPGDSRAVPGPLVCQNPICPYLREAV